MEVISWSSVLFYVFFGIFVYYQQLHVRDFQGESQFFSLLLTLSAFAGMITGLVYLLVYGWTVVWWAPVLIFLISVVVGTAVGVIIESVVGETCLESLGILSGGRFVHIGCFSLFPSKGIKVGGEMEERLFAQPGRLKENLNEFLVPEGNRDADEFVFFPDLGPGDWAEVMRRTQ